MRQVQSGVRVAVMAVGLLSVLATGAVAGRHDEMDYGPYLSGTFKAQGPGENTVLKGIAIPLGTKDRPAGVLFDTELVRFAAGWTGGFLNLQGVAFDGGHGSNPSVKGEQRVATKPGPGWAKGDALADPRSIPHGPLPRDWAKYKGLYRHEEGIVLSYRVGTADVLELPSVEWGDGEPVFVRTLNIAGGTGLTLVACDMPGATVRIEDDVAVVEKDGRAMLVRVNGDTPTTGTVVAGDDGRVLVKIPQGAARLNVVLWGGPADHVAAGRKSLARMGTARDLAPLTRGGKSIWTETVVTQGKRGEDTQAYVLDDLTVPEENPYKSWMRIGGFDFFSDGRAAISTWSGDVWIVSGIDDTLKTLTWKRYAAGLFHGLGLKIVNDTVYVLGRDQITRLVDSNRDGEADFYECFNNDVLMTENFHEFAYELHTDPDGNFYFIKGGPVRPGGNGWDKIVPNHGCLMKVSKDGQTLEVVARGFRAPNGMGLGPKGELTSGDNEGTWTPAVPLNWIRPGGFYGVPDFSDRDPKPTVRDNPLCWMPKDIDNSNGGQVWITGKQFGPLSGQLLHMSYGTCTLFLVLKEEAGGGMQGGVTPLPLRFESGICRARFHEPQNALFVTGLRGWQSRASKDAGFYRVRYTGQPARLATGLHVQGDGIEIRFSEPLDKGIAADPDSYSVEQWNYKWTQNYGSPHFKVSKPNEQGHDELEIDEVLVSADGQSVVLKIADLQPVMQMKIRFNLKTADGQGVNSEIHNTINAVGGKRAELHPGELKVVSE